jgi:endonuclease YncB( thermonuclease family)
MRIGFTWLAFAALALAAAACDEPPRQRPALQAPALGLLNRVTVLQADVLVIDGTRYRLANAFAPEQVPAARCWAEAAAAKASIAAMREMVRSARTVSVNATGPVDAQTRIPAIVQFDGLDAGEALVQRGLAARDGSRRFSWCEPISKNDPRGPPLSSLFDLGR